jgi:hypothetical protein
MGRSLFGDSARQIADQTLSARPLLGYASLATRFHPLPNLIDQCIQWIVPKVRIAFGSANLAMTEGLPNKLQTRVCQEKLEA